eukprot:364231-Chlamydomonas_euryale.AAC.1
MGEPEVSSDPDNVPPRSRLFLVVPKQADEARIQVGMGGTGCVYPGGDGRGCGAHGLGRPSRVCAAGAQAGRGVGGCAAGMRGLGGCGEALGVGAVQVMDGMWPMGSKPCAGESPQAVQARLPPSPCELAHPPAAPVLWPSAPPSFSPPLLCPIPFHS